MQHCRSCTTIGRSTILGNYQLRDEVFAGKHRRDKSNKISPLNSSVSRAADDKFAMEIWKLLEKL